MMQNPFKPQLFKPGENTKIDVQTVNGGCVISIRVFELGVVKEFWPVRLTRDDTIGMAAAMIKAAEIPIDEFYNRTKLSLQQFKEAGGRASNGG